MPKNNLVTLMGYEAVKGTNHNLNILIGNEPHWVRLHEPEATDEQVTQINGKEYTSVQSKMKIRNYALS